ncbi:MAG: diacylglycerol/lipid kinase family protein [Phycisphaeraceae bacterium]
MAEPAPSATSWGGDEGVGPSAVIVAQSNASDQALLDACEQARSAGVTIQIVATASADQTAGVLDQLRGEGVTNIVAAGGDGMVSGVAAALAGHDRQAGEGPCMGVLPMGTGNDFATACGVPTDDPARALRLALSAPPRHVDLGFANDRPFINMCTMGVPAELSAEIDPDMKQRFGRLAYACFGVMRIGRARAVELEVTAGDWSWAGPCLGVMVANGRETGGGFTVASEALLNDGRLDGLIVPDLPLKDWLTLAIDMRAAQVEPKLDELPAWQGDRATLRFAEPVQFTLDGEPDQEGSIQFRVARDALRMRLPFEAPLAESV